MFKEKDCYCGKCGYNWITKSIVPKCPKCGEVFKVDWIYVKR